MEDAMYIARILTPQGTRYALRRTISTAGVLLSQTILDLGPNPCAWYEDGAFRPPLLDAVFAAAGSLDDALLDAVEAAFAPFIPALEDRGHRRSWVRRRLVPEEEAQVAGLHPFDKRRLAFLRTGETNLGAIHLVHPKLFLRLVGKSRDELEQEFWRMECDLRPEELRAYTFAAFNLQSQFACLAARHAPEALDPEAVDAAFLRALCQIHADDAFWQGIVRPASGIHPYLCRYACYHYDFEFPTADSWARIVDGFMGSFRRPRPRRPSRPVDATRAEALFGVPWPKLRAMGRAELIRLFRRRAKALHPDAGGRHEDFVEFLDLYRRLVTRPKA